MLLAGQVELVTSGPVPEAVMQELAEKLDPWKCMVARRFDGRRGLSVIIEARDGVPAMRERMKGVAEVLRSYEVLVDAAVVRAQPDTAAREWAAQW